MSAPEPEWIEFEMVQIEKHSVWQCARPCSRAYRHRREIPKILPAICPTCGHEMKLVDGYWQYVTVTEHHDLPKEKA